jgi:hypothetical protein
MVIPGGKDEEMITWSQLTVCERIILLRVRKLPTKLANCRWDQFPRPVKDKIKPNNEQFPPRSKTGCH